MDYQNGINGNCSTTAKNSDGKLHVVRIKASLCKLHVNDCAQLSVGNKTFSEILRGVCMCI